jgi:cytochrome c oxidase cbb3-type subunit 1
LGLVGLGVIFYFVPKLSGRDLHSYYLALFTFWFLLLFGSFSGIPATAPVPAWVPALSTSATMLLLIPLIAFALNMFGTFGCVLPDWSAHFSLRFVWFGAVSFVVASLMTIFSSFSQVSDLANLTWFAAARTHLQVYGFFAIAMFGAIYYILPRVAGVEFPSAKLIRAHYWLAVIGITLIVVPLALAGIVQGLQMRKAATPFLDILKSTLPFLRISTLGDLLLLAGHVVFLVNIVGLLKTFFQSRAIAAYRIMTTEIKPTEVAS